MDPVTGLHTNATRRTLLLSVGMVVLSAGCGITLPVGQPATPARRVGVLSAGGYQPFFDTFRQTLGEHGWVEGENLTIEWRFADGRDEQLTELAALLVHLPVDVIVTPGGISLSAASAATRTIPIVCGSLSDPVAEGIVQSLARPGGNITGASQFLPQLNAKRLELLRDVIPGLSRVALFDAGLVDSSKQRIYDDVHSAALTLGLELRIVLVPSRQEFQSAFDTLGDGAQAITTTASAELAAWRPEFIEFVQSNRLPALFASREYVLDGCLMAYGVSYYEQYRRAAEYVDKILRGANPAELPIQQPTVFDFFVNSTAAQSLGLTIPSSVAQQVTEWIQ